MLPRLMWGAKQVLDEGVVPRIARPIGVVSAKWAAAENRASPKRHWFRGSDRLSKKEKKGKEEKRTLKGSGGSSSVRACMGGYVGGKIDGQIR